MKSCGSTDESVFKYALINRDSDDHFHSPRTVFVTSTHEKDVRSGRRKPVYAVWKEQCKSICAVYDGYYV